MKVTISEEATNTMDEGYRFKDQKCSNNKTGSEKGMKTKKTVWAFQELV